MEGETTTRETEEEKATAEAGIIENSSSARDSTIITIPYTTTFFSSQVNEENPDTNSTVKKRLVWKEKLQKKFLDALESLKSLGTEKPVPNEILEVMDVEGLTRDHVASHLQKHRLNIQKQKEKDKTHLLLHQTSELTYIDMPFEDEVMIAHLISSFPQIPEEPCASDYMDHPISEYDESFKMPQN